MMSENRKLILFILSESTGDELESMINDPDFINSISDGYRDTFKHDLLKALKEKRK